MGESEHSLTKTYKSDIFSISEVFHENTKIRRLPLWNSIFSSVGSIDEDMLGKMLSSGFKIYANAKSIEMDNGFVPGDKLFEEVLLNRRSIRQYSSQAISYRELSKLLSLSCGITERKKIEEDVVRLRSYPSGGGLFPLEIYPALFNIEGTECGLYHYNVIGNRIELLLSENVKERVLASVMYPEIISNSSLVVIMTAIFPRMLLKYGERGYRFVLLEAGHLAQNLYLVSTSLGLGCVAIGGFIDDELNDLLRIDGVNEAVIYVLAFGKP